MNGIESFLDSSPLLKDRIYFFLKEEILLGRLMPGEQLNILELSRQMGVSSSPVREALTLLSKDGLVELIPRRKPCVASGRIEEFAVILDLRLMLEPYAARISVANIPQEAITAIRAQLQKVLEHPENVLEYVQSDLDLHTFLHKYAHSKLLSDILINLKTASMRYRFLVEQPASGGEDAQFNEFFIQEVTAEHLAIIEAFDMRSPELVVEKVREHIKHYAERNRPFIERSKCKTSYPGTM